MSETPDELELVIGFVNTLDVEEHVDELATADGLAGWLSARLPSRPALSPSEDDRLQAIELREALRAVMLENNGGAPDDQARAQLERTARRGDLGVHFGPDGSISIAAGEQGMAGALAELLAPVAQAISDGSWQRAKACRAEDCQWAFYDRSRNRSGVWCEMAVCGNRTKVRAYRERAPRGSR
jgi:predicted RNA-binding Zn ribbon-like protein